MESEISEPSGVTADPAPGGISLAVDLLEKGGPAIWAIIALSVVALAIILWKAWGMWASGAWKSEEAEAAVALWGRGDVQGAKAAAAAGTGSRARLVAVAMAQASDPDVPRETAVAEITRVAKRILGDAQSGLRGLELIATIAPLLGLFGTVLGMISAFQGLETAGANADASALAGGIWEALLTTAAGMAVAIPVSAALTYYESISDRLRLDLEDLAGQIVNKPALAEPARQAAE
ncbi:MAG: MotA/TolQ/ExbB proton channel family protein [Pikeienuella sp.]